MKIGVSGSHGVGKSFLVYELATKYKLKYPNKEVTVITEIARKCPFKINKEATIETQIWMLSNQMKLEIEATNNCDIVITDRTIVDYLAYTIYLNPEMYMILFNYIKWFVKTYDKIIFKSLKNNDYLIYDGKREIDKNYQKQIDNNLVNIYLELNPYINKLKVI